MKLREILKTAGFAGLLALSGCLAGCDMGKMTIAGKKVDKSFLNYEKGKQMRTATSPISGNLSVQMTMYDVDWDGNWDTIIARPMSDKGILLASYPMFYAFDLNHNNTLEPDEVLIDDKMDGINGNERWFNQFFPQQTPRNDLFA
jgi:hypothetical protein